MTKNDQHNKKAVDEQGKWLGIGLVLGTGIGAATGNIGLGIVIGLVIGAAIGTTQNRKKE